MCRACAFEEAGEYWLECKVDDIPVMMRRIFIVKKEAKAPGRRLMALYKFKVANSAGKVQELLIEGDNQTDATPAAESARRGAD